MNRLVCGALLCIALSCAATTVAQDVPQIPQPDAFSRKNTYTLFAEYSNTSSHILLGVADQRKLADFGGAYTRRIARFWGSDLGYHVELRPVLFESDPLEIETETVTVDYPAPIGLITFPSTSVVAPVTKCLAASGVLQIPPGGVYSSGTYTITCGRQWTFGQAFSPIGFKYSMRTRHPLQPFIVGTLGYMYTSRPVPIAAAEAFNFVFDFGAGVELFRSEKKKHSVALEVRYHHFSNRDTADANPGTDNIVYKVSYSFGR